MSKIFDAYKKQVESITEEVQGPAPVNPNPLFPAPEGKQANDFTQLANRMLGLRPGAQSSVFGFASTTSGEGSSFVSYNTAIVLAHVYNQKVAWVDCNFLSPQEIIKSGPGKTFSTLLRNPDLAFGLKHVSNPLLIGAGSNLISIKGLLAVENYSKVLESLGQQFDFVILDLPPVLGSSDTALMAAGCDGTLLVIEQKFLKWEIVQHGLKVLRDKNVQVLGSVINRRKFVLPKVIYDRL